MMHEKLKRTFLTGGGIMNIPNALTAVRFLLVPIFIYSFYYQSQNNYIIPLLIFLLAGLTDILDGYIARKYNLVTKWGKLLDPLADKLIQISALIVMTSKGIIPIWIVLVVFAKEAFLIVGSALLYRKKIVTQANWYGKLATVLFYIAIVDIIFTRNIIGMYFLGLAVAATLYAATRYALAYLKIKETSNENSIK